MSRKDPAAGTPAIDPYSDGAVPRQPPASKRDLFARQENSWDRFDRGAHSIPGITPAERFAMSEMFGIEGGMGKDSRSGTAANGGITQATLDRAKELLRDPEIAKVKAPKDLTPEQSAKVMHTYLADVLRTSGGAQALESLGDREAAAALAHTLYHHGRGAGAEAIQQAINDVHKAKGGKGDLVPEDGLMGPQTFEAYRRLAADTKTKWSLIDKVADRRRKLVKSDEWKIVDHFRYLDRR